MDTEGGQYVVEQEEGDLDSFFREKDKRKKERQAHKKAKAKAERESAVKTYQQWMTTDDAETGNENVESEKAAQVGDVNLGEGKDEDLATQLQEQAIIYRPEDDEWIDPEREFAPTAGVHKRKQRQQDGESDKLLLLVAPSAGKLQDLSEISTDKIKKTTTTTSSTGSKGWSSVAPVENETAEPAIGETAGTAAATKVSEPDPIPEPEPKKEPEPPAAETEPQGYVPPHRRAAAAAAAAASSASNRSPRAQSPAASTPAPDPPAAGAYIPPSLRRQMADNAARMSSPSSGPSRLAGSGLASRPTAKPAIVLPDLQSAEEFPSLG